MHEADDVVVGALVDRQPRVRHARRDPRGLPDRGARGEELDLGARQQHLADLPLPGVEDLADDAPLVHAQRLRAGDELPHLLLGHRLTALARVGAEQPDHHVDRDGQQPDDGPGETGDHVEHRRGEQRDRTVRCRARRLGASSLNTRLRKVMPVVTMANASGSATSCASLADQPVAQHPGQRRGAVGAGHQRREGGADLYGRQEPVGVGGEPGRLRAPAAAPGQGAYLALPQRDQGHLRRGEEPADGHDETMTTSRTTLLMPRSPTSCACP